MTVSPESLPIRGANVASATPPGPQVTPATTHALEMAHVLFMDIVAYSKLPMDQQQKVLNELQEIVRGSDAVVHAQAEDKLICLPTGDGMALVFFGSPEFPVECALEIGRLLRQHPAIKLRMGIHTGPVYRVPDINANRNVAGGGINMAQRVMDCGDAGHVLVSKVTADVLAQLSAWSQVVLQDLGETDVKHGVRVHIYNLYTDVAGNPKVPSRLQAAAAGRNKAKLHRITAVTAIFVAIALIGSGLYYRSRQSKRLTGRDTIVIADFDNSTGDPVFDDTLKTALTVALNQSPFLNVLSDRKVGETLKLMTLASDAKLTPDVARDLCIRAGSKAYIGGSIAKLGSEYVLWLKTVNCENGETLAQEQVTANGKEKVLNALSDAATKMRARLGETKTTVQKFDTPLEQATTPSLQALQAYSLGYRAQVVKADFFTAISFFHHAITIDPNFAMAYAKLGACYSDLGKAELAAESTRKAYELRGRVSEREKFYIESEYEDNVTGDLEAARNLKELWLQTYPRDHIVPTSLATTYSLLGESSNALATYQEALRIDNENALAYGGLAFSQLNLNRLDAATEAAREAQAQKLDSPQIHFTLYVVHFLQHDAAGMEREAQGLIGTPGVDDAILYFKSDTAAYNGQLSQARELTLRASASARRNQTEETAAGYEAEAALREALVGNEKMARQQAHAALASSRTRDVESVSAIALGLAGGSAEAETLANDLSQRFPKDTIVQSEYLPMIHAAIDSGSKDATKAIAALAAAEPYELGNIAESLNFALYPAYLRGDACLTAHQGAAAVVEFRKLVDHFGVVGNEPIGALAYLGLARAYAETASVRLPAGIASASSPQPEEQAQNTDAVSIAGKSLSLQRARAAYEQFFALWKRADADIPILKKAKAEYAKLK